MLIVTAKGVWWKLSLQWSLSNPLLLEPGAVWTVMLDKTHQSYQLWHFHKPNVLVLCLSGCGDTAEFMLTKKILPLLKATAQLQPVLNDLIAFTETFSVSFSHARYPASVWVTQQPITLGSSRGVHCCLVQNEANWLQQQSMETEVSCLFPTQLLFVLIIRQDFNTYNRI